MSQTAFSICSRSSDVAAYLDGELTPAAETLFQSHLAECSSCACNLNEQKRLLNALEFAFENEKSFALPEDFARIVAVRAEANVSGLRDKRERRRVIWLAVALVFCGELVLLFGGQNAALLAIFSGVLRQMLTIGNFLLGFCYDFGFGAFIVLRAVSRQVFVLPFAGLLCAVLLIVSFAALSRLLVKYHRLEN
jgi:predicted anti-sigma-YlaC factor YlaD